VDDLEYTVIMVCDNNIMTSKNVSNQDGLRTRPDLGLGIGIGHKFWAQSITL